MAADPNKSGRKIPMKKLSIFALIMAIYAGSAFAVGAGVGARAVAMGGTGIAIANDVVSAAYFNPAALMYGPENVDIQLAGGGATQSIVNLAESISAGSDFIANNFDKTLSVNGSVAGGFGFSVKKVGISAIATGFGNFNKPANSLTFDMLGNANVCVPLTLGSSFSTPGLPIASLAVGVNLKAIGIAQIKTNVVKSGVTGIGTMEQITGSGFGFDMGVLAKVTPLLSLGAVVRNLSASANVTNKSTLLTVTAAGDVNPGTETETKTTYTPAPETGIGVGVVVPITGTLIACDLENYSMPKNGDLNKSESFTDTHIGIEQGMLFNMVMLRFGYFTYSAFEDSFYTWGIGFNAGPASLGVASANSVADSNNSVAMAQLGLAF